MFQELEFHMPRVQTSSYHIYERDSAGDEALRLGSETEVLYLLICTCSSVIVGPQKTLSICDLGGCLGNLSPVTLIDLCKFDWVPKTLLFLFSIKNLTVSFWVIWFWACQASSYACPSSVEFVVYSCGAIHSSILRILLSVPQIREFCCKYYDKMPENRALEQ